VVDFRSDWALSRGRPQHDVGHEGVITGRDGFSFCFSLLLTLRTRQASTPINFSHDIHFRKMLS